MGILRVSKEVTPTPIFSKKILEKKSGIAECSGNPRPRYAFDPPCQVARYAPRKSEDSLWERDDRTVAG